MARCHYWSGGHSSALYHREIFDRLVYRKQRRRLKLRCSGRADRAAVMGLLFRGLLGAEFTKVYTTRNKAKNIHGAAVRLRSPPRFRPKGGMREMSARGVQSERPNATISAGALCLPKGFVDRAKRVGVIA